MSQAPSARPAGLSREARERYADALIRGLPAVRAQIDAAAQQLRQEYVEAALQLARRDGVEAWQRHGPIWLERTAQCWRHAALSAEPAAAPQKTDPLAGGLSLVDDDTIEREIMASRLALAIMDRATWEFTDLRTRMKRLDGTEDLPEHDLMRAQVVARLTLESWWASELGGSVWQLFQRPLHDAFAELLAAAYQEVNDWLEAHKVSAQAAPPAHQRPQAMHGVAPGPAFMPAPAGSGMPLPSAQAGMPHPAYGGAGPVMMGHAAGAMLRATGHPGGHPDAAGVVGAGSPGSFPGSMAPMGLTGPIGRFPSHRSQAAQQADQVLAHLYQRLEQHVPHWGPAVAMPAMQQAVQAPVASASDAAQWEMQQALSAAYAAGGVHTGFLHSTPATLSGVTMSGRLQVAMQRTQALLRGTQAAPLAREAPPPPSIDEIKERSEAAQKALKSAADTPAERATIEVVALLFQSILTEEKLPASVRVWFARLQMPVLRVAVIEPDFFASTEHPARQLIDRMGESVMGFSAAGGGDVTEAVGREVKRIVQVIEAYPETGGRVFQTVLTEFEAFLARYFEHENKASRKSISLAQQIEQRETLAIQYTIELRKMLTDVPVQEGVREFLFQVWADVLAVTAVRAGAQSEETKVMKRAAADLIWSAAAKSTREDRAEVIRRLPPLLKVLREGMSHAGLPQDKQDAQIRLLNNALAAAFSAKASSIPTERLEELMGGLEALEAVLPEDHSAELDEALVRDLSGQETEGLEVVSRGGTDPSPAMLAWARELQVGSWYMLDFRGRQEAVQLAWRGRNGLLVLFVTPKGRAVLFPLPRLAAYLQAALLQPAQDEALTVKATRDALAKIDANPSRLLQ